MDEAVMDCPQQQTTNGRNKWWMNGLCTCRLRVLLLLFSVAITRLWRQNEQGTVQSIEEMPTIDHFRNKNILTVETAQKPEAHFPFLHPIHAFIRITYRSGRRRPGLGARSGTISPLFFSVFSVSS
ncbi:MAG: hypothetical protein IH600_17765 [Bacteroidetes bacterium]|nr:hypothetical protein [Bacteroidota bacterium]